MPGDADALPLAAAKSHACSPTIVSIAIRQLSDNELMKIGDLGRTLHAIDVQVSWSHAECDVRRKSVVG